MYIKNATPLKNSPPLKIETQAPSPLFENLVEGSAPLQADIYADNTSMKITNTPFFKTTLLYQLHPFFGKI